MIRMLCSVLLAAMCGLSMPAHATGFGGASDTAPTRIPVPAKDFTATVEDRSGVEVEVKRVSFNGDIHISGALGEGEVSIPFERIRELRVEPTGSETRRIAWIQLKNGESVRVDIPHDTPCYGATSFGHYRIEVSRIRRIVFGDVPRAAAQTSTD